MTNTSAARAADCPSEPPGDPIERREVARVWFDRAQAAQEAGHDVEAVSHYVCSFKMVRHAFTAFNLARLAEATGDIELAISSYRAYLQLSPGAPDEADVRARIDTLEQRLERVRLEGPDTTTPSPPTAPALPAKPAGELSSGAPGSEAAHGEANNGSGLVGWSLAGVGIAAVGAGVVLNLLARDEMKSCRSMWDSDRTTAEQACDAARPRAYGSYAALGLGTASLVAGILVLNWDALRSGDEGPERTRGVASPASSSHAQRPSDANARVTGIGVAPVSGGGLVSLSGLFD